MCCRAPAEDFGLRRAPPDSGSFRSPARAKSDARISLGAVPLAAPTGDEFETELKQGIFDLPAFDQHAYGRFSHLMPESSEAGDRGVDNGHHFQIVEAATPHFGWDGNSATLTLEQGAQRKLSLLQKTLSALNQSHDVPTEDKGSRMADKDIGPHSCDLRYRASRKRAGRRQSHDVERGLVED